MPNLGMLGFLVAYTKVGKTSLSQRMGEAVAGEQPFLGKVTTKLRVLYIAAEDPPEYTAYVARHLCPEPGSMTFYRRSVILNDLGLAAISECVRNEGYGLVIIASWQSVVRGLVKDENDNAGAVVVVERVKAVTRELKVPWVIEAHSGKSEDQEDDADPTKAMRGASSAPGAADYTLYLRYANGPFGSRRRLSGKGRFVNFAPLLLDYNLMDGTYRSLGSAKDAGRELTWALIVEKKALTTQPKTIDQVAKAAGLVSDKTEKVTGHGRRLVREALYQREGVVKTEETRKGKMVAVYSLSPGQMPLDGAKPGGQS